MTKILEVKDLSKNFGRIKAVDGLNLSIDKGQVYGILGPNGSGKTTTLGMLLDVIVPKEGTYSWFEGKNPVDSRKDIGAILETPCFYSYLTAVQNLKIVALIKECSNDRIEAVLQQVGLFDRKDDAFKTYSLGMKQRLSIAAALISDPPVLILDEPTNGLDPEGIAEVRELIAEIAKAGKTIIMASHLLDEVQKVCTHFCVLRKGKKLHEGAVNDILGETDQVEVSAIDSEKMLDVLKKYDGIQSINDTSNEEVIVNLTPGKKAADLNAFCFDNGLVLTRINPLRNSLEQEFLKILKDSDK